MMLRTSSFFLYFLILLIFVILFVSGLSASDGVLQATKIEENATLAKLTKAVNVTNTQNGDISGKLAESNETKIDEVAKPVEIDDGTKINNPDVGEINQNSTTFTNSSGIESSSIKPSTNTSIETIETNIGTSNDNKTEPEAVTEISVTSVLSENSTESATNVPNSNTTEKIESIDAAMKEKFAAANPLGPKPEDMSSGVVALVMAIVFAVVVIIIYAGLLGWRRYLEYRYGNRELLVNDLEFDTNDLRHFEL